MGIKGLSLFTILCVSITVAQNSATNTNCQINGNTANCTSTTQHAPQAATPSQSLEQGYRVGRDMGQPLGQAIAYHRANRWVKKFCKKHPGASWWYSSAATGRLEGTCPY